MSQDQKPQQERGYASKTSPHGSTCTTWVEDEKSWNEYQGVSVVERMENIKATLKGGLARAQAEADAQATGESSTIPNTAESKVMTETVQALQDILPADLRASLPWSALVNLMNTGLARVGWSFLGPSQSNGKEGWKVGEEAATAANSGNEAGVTLSPAAAAPASAAERLAALTEALHGVMHWLPDAALDHTATPTVDPSSLGPEKSWAEYQAMCPVTYPSQPVLTILSPSFPRRPYKSRDDNSNPKKEGEGGRDEGPPPYVRDPHWGQRKLFLNELELLTKYGEDGDVVVYAGAAPGRHIEHLSKELFPTLKFVLVDPAPFRIRESESLKLVAGLMTDALAREYAGRENVIFISDIRRTYASEDLILEDMLDQQRWHELMNPKVSMLKFRLPWRAGETEYLEGEVWTQPYAKARSTETRLVVKGREGGKEGGKKSGLGSGGGGGGEGGGSLQGDGGEGEGGGGRVGGRRMWENRLYEEQCFFFNTVVRPARHAHGVRGAALEDTWDYAREVEIWREYLRRREGRREGRREEENEVIARLSVRLTRHLEGAQGREWMRRIDWRVVGEGRREGGGGEGRGRRRNGNQQHQRRNGGHDWRDRRGREGGEERRRRPRDDEEEEREDEEEKEGEESDLHHHHHRHRHKRSRHRREREERGEAGARGGGGGGGKGRDGSATM